jgi:hypothetical protein
VIGNAQLCDRSPEHLASGWRILVPTIPNIHSAMLSSNPGRRQRAAQLGPPLFLQCQPNAQSDVDRFNNTTLPAVNALEWLIRLSETP